MSYNPGTNQGMKITGASNGKIEVTVKSYRTPDADPYTTIIDIATAHCTCTCPQHTERVVVAAEILKVIPRATGDLSCKHARDAHALFIGG